MLFPNKRAFYAALSAFFFAALFAFPGCGRMDNNSGPALLDNPEYVAPDVFSAGDESGKPSEFRRSSRFYKRSINSGRLVREYFGDGLRRTGMIIVAAGRPEPVLSPGEFSKDIRFILRLAPGTGYNTALERLKLYPEALRCTADTSSAEGSVLLLGVPAGFLLKAGSSGSVESLKIEVERFDRDSDTLLLASLAGLYGEPKAPYLSESSDNVTGTLGGMQNTYKKYDCKWETDGFTVSLSGDYTYNYTYAEGSKEGKNNFYFKGKIEITGKSL